MDYMEISKSISYIKAYLEKKNYFLKDFKDKDDLIHRLSTLYITLVEENYLKTTNVLAFRHIVEEDYHLSFYDVEDFIVILIGVHELLQKERVVSFPNLTGLKKTPIKSGYVYILSNPLIEGVIEIRRTIRDPETEIEELYPSHGLSSPVLLVYKEYFLNCIQAEAIIHGFLEERNYQVTPNKTFFSFPISEAITLLKSIKSHLPIREKNGFPWPSREKLYFGTAGIIHDFIKKGTQALQGWEDTMPNFSLAFDYLEKAGNLGSAEAYLIMGKTLIKPPLDDEKNQGNVLRALEYFEKGVALKDGPASNHCIAELAGIFSGKHLWADAAFTHESNAKLCWGKYFESFSLKTCDGTDSIYLSDYLQSNLYKQKETGYEDKFFEQSLQYINWFKYDIISTANWTLTLLDQTKHKNKERWLFTVQFLENYFSFDQNLLAHNQNSGFNHYLNITIMDLYRINQQVLSLSVEFKTNPLQVGHILCLHSILGPAYVRLLDIIMDDSFETPPNSVKRGILILEDHCDDYPSLEKLIKEKPGKNNVKLSIKGDYPTISIHSEEEIPPDEFVF